MQIDGTLHEDQEAIKHGLVDHFKRNFHKRRGWKPAWEDGTLPRLSVDFIELLEKEGARLVEEYRPICLVNGAYVIIAKVMANRLKRVCGELVEDTQSAFLPRRNLQEGFLTAQEVVAAVSKEQKRGLIFKLEFTKAYDSVDREFLLRLLGMHGFPRRWIRMVRQCIVIVHASRLINGEVAGFFPLNRGFAVSIVVLRSIIWTDPKREQEYDVRIKCGTTRGNEDGRMHGVSCRKFSNKVPGDSTC
ncbi:hypothetical protein QJS10_CPB19g00132 [Acorus calamus]|uniref:Reverse transcriptase domain-containing protein n=1 Tax=Acorus calamus TaxID=4465 RepID=A0AAV9CJE6_ACOCL|nr:hypothetical protein QJS10_CPB19g00132 [Acorus calamus]